MSEFPAVNDAYGNSTNPPLILYNLDQQKIRDLQAAHDWGAIAALYTEAAKRLRASGAQGIIFCANTPHKVYAQVARNLDIPILHIAKTKSIWSIEHHDPSTSGQSTRFVRSWIGNSNDRN